MSKLSERLTSRAAELNISQTDLAARVEMSQPSISDLFAGLTASPRKWREIAKELQIDEKEMLTLIQDAIVDAGKTQRVPRSISSATASLDDEPNGTIDPSPVSILSGKPVRMLPVLGEAVGGADGQYAFNGQILDYVACPPSLTNVPNAYAVWIDGESMYPRYKSGELVYVHPGKPARRGDDVIVQIKPHEEDMPPRGFVKELVGYVGDKLVLKQYNPDSKIEFPRDDVISIHPITFSGKY
ncbi:LexA family transcriptional regulator [Rhizobium laguerreae]|uniref:LexA family transcriptional regulator n=1 Tax=Rhizobium laguerreae TaxID=1076926 RepID=UPI001C90DC53|nr:S24 family peptidase [Rhizobium laguerreae]MBY3434871.1 helix-turn-helix transcriptional regulator [Rhizobium laguerreae]MBY3449013.1 helix-turn-helix transcriptional regulator [Rhizobium laguerreae]MBY3456787.1 helix-turn-helix transcriptional regulator [Rhizobium laguerreae]